MLLSHKWNNPLHLNIKEKFSFCFFFNTVKEIIKLQHKKKRKYSNYINFFQGKKKLQKKKIISL
jgi:hypothetical protein